MFPLRWFAYQSVICVFLTLCYFVTMNFWVGDDYLFGVRGTHILVVMSIIFGLWFIGFSYTLAKDIGEVD